MSETPTNVTPAHARATETQRRATNVTEYDPRHDKN